MRIELTEIIQPDLTGDSMTHVQITESDVQITRDQVTVTLNHREMDALISACRKFNELQKVIE